MSSSQVIEISLPQDFSSLLQKEITQELAEAQRKWKVKLTSAQEKTVRQATERQLSSKVSGLAKNEWKLEPTLTINVVGGSGKLKLDANTKNLGACMILLNKNGWSITEEETDSAVPLERLYAETLRTIFTWARTAVFYGVGSYA